ncbi:FtsX-like permease family protein [Intrasporangium sp. YIM S08009]|uniref:FtsX-like permease family protein n=1 Tax=Intrasporangium zincisolvens TaxID=3080018 RepID=UPI002B05FCF8|nr:FtsX-like permease family protein [Intrasporangium sp. YIM S08009]
MGTTGVGGRDASRLDRWRSSWRVSLRMARRDVRRHRGRSLLVVIMVGLPVLLLTASTTLWFSDDLDASERLPFQLGSSQGYVMAPQPVQLRQLLDPMSQVNWDTPEPPRSRPVPGLVDRAEGPAMAALLGARAIAVSSAPTTFRVDRHFISGLAIGADVSDPGVLAPRASLASGRWPTGPDEAIVTPDGIEKGLPASGTVGVRALGSAGELPERVVTIVGVGRGFDAQGAGSIQAGDLVTTAVASDYASRGWLVDRDRPITWGEVERLNTYGIGVFSRYVAEHPETMTRANPDASTSGPSTTTLVIVLAALGLVVLTTLLAGPAFAVGAARQRRTLALAASNGATTRQLRRTVLAQALVLGVLSAAVGAAVGVGGGVGTVLATRLVRPDLFFGPLEVPWPAVALVALAAVVSSVVAAVLPSRGLGRLDIVSVLRGQSVSPRLRRRVPVAGALLVVAGAATVTWASYVRPQLEFLVFGGGSLAIVVGSLLIVPLVLSLVARVAHLLPLPVRMAAREAGRQRGRATPTVAAIMAGASALTVVCIGMQADTIRAARDYTAMQPEGLARVQSGLADTRVDELAGAVRQTAPELHTLVLRDLTAWDLHDGSTVVAAQRPGCSLAQTLPQPVGGNVATPPPDTRCQTIASFSRDMVGGASLQTASLEQLDAFVDLTPSQHDALAAGAVAVVDPAAVAGLTSPAPYTTAPDIDHARPVLLDESDGSATLARWRVRLEPSGAWRTPSAAEVATVRLPVVHLTREQWRRTTLLYSTGAVILTPATAERMGLAPVSSTLLVRADGGISPDVESRVNDAIRAVQNDAHLVVERGYQRDDTVALLVVFGVIGLIILAATLIATALSQAENAPLLGTLAAVGATRRTRRALAGSQALYLGLLGAVLGLLVGLAPGLGLARVVLTRITEDARPILPGSLDVPWLQVLLPVVLVPVVAGALAWVSIRRAPTVVRRTT